MFAGLDLAGKKGNPSGFCVLNKEIYLTTLKNNMEILEEIGKNEIKILAIDSPLSLPEKSFRKSDKLLKEKGFKPLPLTFPAMRMLAERAIEIRDCINENKITVIEAFPRATEKILKIGKKRFMGKHDCNEHEYDAYLAGLTAEYFYKNKFELLGGEIVIPKS